MDTPTPAGSAWEPLRHPIFRYLWLASFASNVGTLMHTVGASWLMITLSASPLMVALVQTAINLPTFMMALPAGALADVVDRRKLLLWTQSLMLIAAAGLGIMTVMGLVTPWGLLAATFVLGLGGALNGPAWQAIVPELVPREQLGSAVALNSAGFNLARAVGPALGGLIVAQVGAGATFLLNACSFVAVLVVIALWKREVPESVLPAERVMGAMRSGVRYVLHAPVLKRILFRTGCFMIFGSALWALLPLIAKDTLGLGPEGYGLLLASLGLGAVAGAVGLPRLRKVSTLDQRVAGATLLYAFGSALPALVPHTAVACLGLFLAGMAWLVLMSGFNTAVQTVSPEWVRGRTLSVYLLVVFGGLAVGSTLWGALAGWMGIAAALWVPSIGMVVALALTYWLVLARAEVLNVAPSMHWPPPTVAMAPGPDEGPVFVNVTYHIDPASKAGFIKAMILVRRMRLRSGAIRWTLLGDLSVPGRFVESFMVESWMQHLRQHERVTVLDRENEARAKAFHIGPEPPHENHLLAQNMPHKPL